MSRLTWCDLWEGKITKELWPDIFSGRETKERVCIFRCLKSVFYLGEVKPWLQKWDTDVVPAEVSRSQGASVPQKTKPFSLSRGRWKQMRQHIFFKTVPQELLSWCLGPPASSTCVTSSVPWLCATPASHHLKKSGKKLSLQFLSAGWNYYHKSRQEQCKGFPTYVTFLYHWYNSFTMLRKKHNVLVNRSRKKMEILYLGWVCPGYISLVQPQFKLLPLSIYL